MNHNVSLREAFLHPISTAVSRGTEPIYSFIAYDAQSYLERTPLYKIVKKFFHKYLTLLLRNQIQLMRSSIGRKDKVLVLYTGKDSFGDSNLELCGRALLEGKDYALDLLTLPKLAPQFQEDEVFGAVFTNISQVEVNRYDLVLLAEFNHRSIRLKCKYFRETPFACLFGYFDGPPRNQAAFSFAAFSALYGLGIPENTLLQMARPHLRCSQSTLDSVVNLVPKAKYAVISVGGVDPYRTYGHWDALLKLVDSAAFELDISAVVLVGSNNGEADAKQLCEPSFSNISMFNFVGQLSLLQTRAVILGARIFAGCDGGLMHVTHSTGIPTVSLFSKKEPYQYWLTPACNSQPLQSGGSASEIAPGKILQGMRKALTPARQSEVL